MPTAEQCKACAAEYQAIGTARDISILRAILQPLLIHEEGPLMMVYQEKIAPPGPLPAHTEPPVMRSFQRTIETVEQENEWLKEQLAGIVRS